MDDSGEEFVSRGKGGAQWRRVRKDGWTKKRRELFLDHYAATGNAAAACRAAGMAEGAAYRLRRRDPQFAEQYDEAHGVSLVRLEGLVANFAETKGEAGHWEPGEIPPVDLSNFDPELALKVLRRPRPSKTGYADRCGARPKVATEAETDAEIIRLLKALKKRTGPA